MSTFLEIVLGVPTLLFTIPLCLAVFYWLLALVGAVDLEIFDGIDGSLDGALDGALDAGVDGAIDGALDAAVDGAAEGAAEGAADAAADGVAEGGTGLVGPLLWLAGLLRVGKVPITVSMTVWVLAAWVVSFLAVWTFLKLSAAGLIPFAVFAVAVVLLALVVGLVVANIAVRPLEPIFETALARDRKSLLGETAELTTGRVDPDFGQATLLLGGDDLVIQVRCDRRGNGLVRGDQVLIVSYDKRREAYVVEPLASAKLSTEEARQSLGRSMPLPATREAPP